MDPKRIKRILDLLREINVGGVRDRRVLEAIALVPRERFVTEELAERAWNDVALPIEEQQTISQPLVVGLMTQALRLSGTEHVLEIGTGSGYQTAVLCRLARSIISVERIPGLAESARQVLGELGYHNVQIVVGDGTEGAPEYAPYDRIIVTAAAPSIPAQLLHQLADVEGARLVIPVGPRELQELLVIERQDDRFVQHSLGEVRFVPLIGQDAFDKDDEPDEHPTTISDSEG